MKTRAVTATNRFPAAPITRMICSFGARRARARARRNDLRGALALYREICRRDSDFVEPRAVEAVPGDFSARWKSMLQLPETATLRASLVDEVVRYFGIDPNEAQRLLDAPLPEGWTQDRYDSEEQVRELFASDPAFLLANLRFADTDKYVLVRHLIARFARRNNIRRLLDYGCGTGNMAIFLAKTGISQIGCADVSEAILKLVSWRFGIRGLDGPECIDLSRPPAPLDRFGMISAIDLFEVVPDISETMRLIDQMLSPAGILAVTLSIAKGKAAAQRAWAAGPEADVVAKALTDMEYATLDAYHVRRKCLLFLQRSGKGKAS